MERSGPVFRLSLGIVVLTTCILVFADIVGLVPAQTDVDIEARLILAETIATQVMPAAQRNDMRAIRQMLDLTVARNESVLSAGVRSARGNLVVVAGKHRTLWNPKNPIGSTPTHVRLPLIRNQKEWGVVELRFEVVGSKNVLLALWERPVIRLIVAVGMLGFIVYTLYLRRALRHLDPSAVIPTRVQNALDVMSEGVLLLDQNERIVLANSTFSEKVGRTPASLRGMKASKLDWKSGEGPGSRPRYPWIESVKDGTTMRSVPLRFELEPGEVRTFAVNTSPVLDGWDKPKGSIATFDDVTLLEEKTRALEAANIELEKSRDEIQLHSQEMEKLSKRDPLTGVSNRRGFMAWAERRLAAAQVAGTPFSCLMADIDHFKAVNDIHGHPVGDEVILRVGKLFAAVVRSDDAVCRYGGEEFCIAFPNGSIEVAARIAERLRQQIEAEGFAPVPVSMSFGITSSAFGAQTLSELLDQADKALYASKEWGRNRVSRFDELPG